MADRKGWKVTGILVQRLSDLLKVKTSILSMKKIEIGAVLLETQPEGLTAKPLFHLETELNYLT